MSRRDRHADPPMSFFSFQDIITSVTGILILVTLLLALELLTRVEVQQTPIPSAAEITALQEDINEARQHHARLREDGRRLQTILTELSGTSPIAPAVELSNAERTLAVKQRALDETNAALERASAAKARALAEVNRLHQLAVEASEKAEAASAAVSAAERMDHRFLLPGKGTKKQPLLVECAAKQIRVGSVGPDGQLHRLESWNGWEATSAFINWAGDRNTSAEFFVVMVRPDAVSDSEEIIKELREKGFDVGWDAVPAKERIFSR